MDSDNKSPVNPEIPRDEELQDISEEENLEELIPAETDKGYFLTEQEILEKNLGIVKFYDFAALIPKAIASLFNGISFLLLIEILRASLNLSEALSICSSVYRFLGPSGCSAATSLISTLPSICEASPAGTC